MLARAVGATLCCVVGLYACGGGDELFGPSGADPFGGGGSGGGSLTTSTTTSATTSDTTTSDTTTTDTTTSDTTTTDTTTTSTTSTGTGGEGGAEPCLPPMHLCGAACVGNTPATGCYLSWTCLSCPTVAHGTAGCSGAGQCTFSCIAPYVPDGDHCVCPTQCCQPADCQAPAVCTDGQCVGACDPMTCMLNCIMQNYSTGNCMQPGGCVCM